MVLACAAPAVEDDVSPVQPGVYDARASSDDLVWTCGDGRVDAAETCDDGNRDAGDGCDARCAAEPGFVCQGDVLSSCAPVCGDGLVLGDETCDDSNTQPGDGCLACQIEAGYDCYELGGSSICAPVCGDGIVLARAGEACDDGNVHPGDGCSSACTPEPGYCCDPAAGYCMPHDTFALVGAPRSIADGTYDGTLQSMSCVEIEVAAPGICNHGDVQHLRVELGVEHPRAGELTIKLMSPSGVVTTLASMPGFDEPVDGALAGEGALAALSAFAPIVFDDWEQDAVDAEDMGGGLSADQTVCVGDGRCAFLPNPGAAVGEQGLDDFFGEAAGGTWSLCVGDAGRGQVGSIESVTLSYRAM